MSRADITGSTRLMGLIGTPVEHSGSPAMYNYCFDKMGLDYAYLAFSVDIPQVEEFLKLGGQVCICNACMEHNGFKAEQMDERYVLINAPDVVSLLMGAKGSLQIT